MEGDESEQSESLLFIIYLDLKRALEPQGVSAFIGVEMSVY